MYIACVSLHFFYLFLGGAAPETHQVFSPAALLHRTNPNLTVLVTASSACVYLLSIDHWFLPIHAPLDLCCLSASLLSLGCLSQPKTKFTRITRFDSIEYLLLWGATRNISQSLGQKRNFIRFCTWFFLRFFSWVRFVGIVIEIFG